MARSTVIAETSEVTPIDVGDQAPDFTLPDQGRKEWRLKDHSGKKPVVLFFYPADWSPTCTKENACFTRDLSVFSKYAEVAAVSADSVWSHKAWADKLGLKHSLLSDAHRSTAKAYGLYVPSANLSQRATVIIDRGGRVAFVHVEEDISRERDYAKVLAFLEKM